MNLRAKTPALAIVTGAAGGMGSATAARFAAQGWSLVVCDLDAGRLEQMAAQWRKSAARVEILAGNVADADFPARLTALLADRPIGALVHAAGLSPTMGDAATILDVNYGASIRLVEAVRPRMAEGACAVLIASSSGYSAISAANDAALDSIGPAGDVSTLLKLTPVAGHAYALSKRGVHRLVERQAMAFGERKARIMSISPGLIDTAMGRAEAKAHPIMDKMRVNTPLGRYGTGDEIASVAVFLCSPDASFVSGSDIKVDGGVLAVMR